MKSDWDKMASNLLKAEMTRRGIDYENLRLRLAKIGVEKSKENLIKTINLGKFSFAFFLQCTKAIGLDKLHFD